LGRERYIPCPKKCKAFNILEKGRRADSMKQVFENRVKRMLKEGKKTAGGWLQRS
jgi:hypothetical protein